jgi:uncharacterized membrane protein YdbT with pleckstrin-like domain
LGYIEKTLGGEEKLLCKAHFHWLKYAEAWASFLIIFTLGGAVRLLIPDAGYWPVGIGAFLAFTVLLLKMLPLWTTEIGVTDHRLIVKRGWLVRTTDELQLRAIEQTNLNQSFMGRLLDYGRVDVHGTGVDDVGLPPIAAPAKFLRTLQDATAHAQKAAKLIN